jgi:hypothetical protein
MTQQGPCAEHVLIVSLSHRHSDRKAIDIDFLLTNVNFHVTFETSWLQRESPLQILCLMYRECFLLVIPAPGTRATANRVWRAVSRATANRFWRAVTRATANRFWRAVRRCNRLFSAWCIELTSKEARIVFCLVIRLSFCWWQRIAKISEMDLEVNDYQSSKKQ